MPKAFHLPHSTDTRRTVGGHARTACGRWVSFAGAAWHTPGNPERPWHDPALVCIKCRVAVVIADSANV